MILVCWPSSKSGSNLNIKNINTMRWRIGFLVTFLACVISLVGGLNYWFAHRSLSAVISSDSRNNGIEIFAHWESYVFPSTLVIDMRNVSGENSPADVFRVILNYAAVMKERDFKSVELAFRGETKFILKGSYFKTLGVEFGEQNAMYTVRTFPESIFRPDGRQAFGTWTGGILGVLGKQLEDFNTFHREWYIDGLVSARK